MMAAVVSPSHDFVKRRRRSIHAEDQLFKSLKGLQEINKSQRQLTRRNSINAGRGQQGTTPATSRNPGRRMQRRSSIGGNIINSTGTQVIYDDVAVRPQPQVLGESLPNTGAKGTNGEDKQSSTGGTPRRMRRRGSTGIMAPSAIIPDSLTSDTMGRISAAAAQLNSSVNPELQPPSLETHSSVCGPPRRMCRRGSIGRAPSEDIINPELIQDMSPETLRLISTAAAQFSSGVNPEPQPPNLESAPRRMPRRGSVGRAPIDVNPVDVHPASRPPSLETDSSSGGAPRRMLRRGSIGGAPVDRNPEPQPPSLETHSSGGGPPRRMPRRGSIGRAPVDVNPEPHQPPNLERQSSGGAPRRMRRRGSVGRAPVDVSSESQPPSVKTRSSGGGPPRRMPRRGSIGRAPVDVNPASEPPSLETNSSDGPPRRIPRRGSVGRAPVDVNPLDVNPASQPPSLETHSSSGGTPRRMRRRGSIGGAPVDVNPASEPPSLETNSSSGGASRRMPRRGSVGRAPVDMNPESLPPSVATHSSRGGPPRRMRRRGSIGSAPAVDMNPESQPPSVETHSSVGGPPRRMPRRDSIGSAPAVDMIPDMSPETMRLVNTAAAQFNSGGGIESQPPSDETHSSGGGPPRRMPRRGSIGRAPVDVNPEPQPPSLERQSSGGAPRRMRRRGSIGRAPVDVNPESQTPSLGTNSSGGGPPNRMRRRGSIVRAPEVDMNPEIIPDMSPETMRLISTAAAQFNSDVNPEPQLPSLEPHPSDGAPRRMRRRGSIGSAPVDVNPEPQPPSLETHSSSGGPPRRMRRRGSIGRAPIDLNSEPQPPSLETDSSGAKPKDEGRTKPDAATTDDGAPLVIRSFHRSSDLMSSTSSFDSMDWGFEESDRTLSTKPTSEGSISIHRSAEENYNNSNPLLQHLMEKLKDPAEMERRRVERERRQKKAQSFTTKALDHNSNKVTEKLNSSMNFKTFLTRSKRGYGHQANLS